jgi:hypothetical protein
MVQGSSEFFRSFQKQAATMCDVMLPPLTWESRGRQCDEMHGIVHAEGTRECLRMTKRRAAGDTGVMRRGAYGSLLRFDRRIEMEIRALSG